MANEMVLERTSNLVMPSHYVELDREEMSYVEGGFWGKLVACIAGAVCGTCAAVAGIITACTAKDTATKAVGVLTVISGVAGDVAAVAVWF